MRKEYGLEPLVQGLSGHLSAKSLSTLLLVDLKNCHCLIMGRTAHEETVTLAKLLLLPDTLSYEMFDHRIEFTVAGSILSGEFPALTYRVEGELFGFYGRCSTIPRVCGVDLYLSKSYTGVQGEMARQHFALSVPRLFKQVKRGAFN